MTIVVATRNRRDRLLRTLRELVALGRPVVVVDNGSDDGSADAVRAHHASVSVIALETNAGSSARNLGARAARTPYVAFADDDSAWAPGSLERAGALLQAHSNLGLVAARVLVGDDGTVDPLSRVMARSPLGPMFTGASRRVLGFMACAAVVRRRAFLDVGGFAARFVIGGEEELVALDLRSAGWELAYVPDVVAFHRPAPRGHADHVARRRVLVRNALWTAWLRYPQSLAIAATRDAVRRASDDEPTAHGVRDAMRDADWAMQQRRPVPPRIAREIALLRATSLRAAS